MALRGWGWRVERLLGAVAAPLAPGGARALAGEPWPVLGWGLRGRSPSLPYTNPTTPPLSFPAVYAVHNLSEVSLTQYELDSK